MNPLPLFPKSAALFPKSPASFLRRRLGFFLPGLLLLLAACSEEDFSTSPSDQPYFMADTLSFDTLISTVPASTRQIVLYNPNDKDLRIERIGLRSGGASGFMINVDGQPGNDAEGNYWDITGVELWKQDSLFILVEACLPEQHADEPREVTDEIVVQTNGETRRIVLHAYAQDALILRGRTLEADTTVSAGKPLVIYDSLTVAGGATLTCSPGARLMFHNGAGLRVRGTLRVEGTREQPVVFRGDRMDRLFSYLPYDNTPGLWEGIRFFPESAGNSIAWADIHSANTSVRCDSAADLSQPKLTLSATRIHNSAYSALQLEKCRVEAANCLLSNSGRELVAVVDGEARLVHCSLLNFYPFALRDEALVRAWSYLPEAGSAGDAAPSSGDTTRVRLDNCLLSGRANSLSPDTLSAVTKGLYAAGNTQAVRIEHATSFSDCEHYRNLNEGGDYRYDFHPTAENCGRDVLTTPQALETAGQLPTDLDGLSRLGDGRPDAGCHEVRAMGGAVP